MSKRLLQLAALCLFAFTMLGASDSTTRVDKIGHNLVCQCGCGQILMECNHVGCPVSPVMLDELRTQVASGSTGTAVQNFFIGKYGPIVLAAPMRGGFDNVAWIVPIVALFGCLIGVILIMRVWKKRALVPGTTDPAMADRTFDSNMSDRIRGETDYDHWSHK